MKIAITGATGLVGKKLTTTLLERYQGKEALEVRIISRQKTISFNSKQVKSFVWNPENNSIDHEALKDVDIVVHLAGEGVADGRWTDKRKKRIRDSRIHGTNLLMQELKSLSSIPKKFISASAIGIYGDKGNKSLDESSALGEGFLAELCKDWESGVQNHGIAGMKAYSLRIGIVLAKEGGALSKMLPPFKLGVGGILGNGQQHMSWIHINDLVGQIIFLIENDCSVGVYNAVAPSAVTNYQFTKTLGKVLKRPTLFPAPAFGLKVIFGEMSEILLASQLVHPIAFLKAGYKFQFHSLETALENLLTKKGISQSSQLQFNQKGEMS